LTAGEARPTREARRRRASARRAGAFESRLPRPTICESGERYSARTINVE
jgi:hypothetical protein